MKRALLYLCILISFSSCTRRLNTSAYNAVGTFAAIKAVNEDALPKGNKTIAITGVTLIDGNGGEPVREASVVIEGNTISNAGRKESIKVPAGAEIVDAKGKYLMPGLIDAHFHLDGIRKLPNRFLMNGVTSIRDPGEWIDLYDEERAAGYPLPRLFLTGPHLDMPPSAHPAHSFIVRDAEEAVREVNKLADQGASAIKIYYRLSLGVMEAICRAAHQRGIPVTAHLEITDAREVILAGSDGIEHVTSFGISLLSDMKAEQYRQAVLADNNARKKGRYEVWGSLDINSKKVDSLVNFLKEHKTFLCPTLAVFEYRLAKDQDDAVQAKGFKNMMAFVAKAQKAGVRVVAGSHSIVPYANEGWAYQREMELMAESGISNAEIITAATIQNARFFRIENRLGSIEKGKLADLLLLDENPLVNINALRKINRVMVNGVWIERK